MKGINTVKQRRKRQNSRCCCACEDDSQNLKPQRPMLSIVQAIKSRRARAILFNNAIIVPFPSPSPSPISINAPIPIHHLHLFYYSTAPPISIEQVNFNPTSTAQLVVASFKDWFKLRPNDTIDRIFHILDGQVEVNDLALSQLGLNLNESLVLEVLSYGFQNKQILSCLQFFDWAGRQPGYSHGRPAFQAIFKILSRAKLTSLMLDFLDTTRYCQNSAVPGYHATLVMGYSLAGKPDLALQIFGRMRFQGIDLDIISYHVLLRSLVEGGCFDAVKQISKQISLNGFENHATRSILVKSLCKQDMLDEAHSYLREVIELGDAKGHGNAVGVLVNALCQKGSFDKAGEVIEEFKEMGVAPMAPAYGVWLNNLVRDGKLDGALEFLKSKNSSEGYLPETFHYNKLLCRLLKENRLRESCDLLLDMMEDGIPPDEITMNATLCFFCKAGMVDVALNLYKCRSVIRRSPSFLSYNYLIDSMCAEGYTDEAYDVFKNRAEQGYFPTRKTFLVVVDSLCREGKLDKVKELVLVALKQNVIPSVSIYDKLISPLCRGGKVEECFLIYEELSRMNEVCERSTYLKLIQGFVKLKRGDIVSRLLIEMQEKSHKANRRQFRAIIRSMFHMPITERQFLILLERQLHDVSNCEVYNNFIDGVARAERPDLARQVFELMKRRGVQPNISSFVLLLKSYLGNNRISDALKFFGELRQSIKMGKKLYSSLIIGLSQANREDIAIIYLTEMRSKKLVPTNECYEVLVQQLCYKRQYEEVVDIVKNLDRDGRQVTSYLGNTLLLHCLRSGELYDAWIRVMPHATSANLSRLGQLLGVFSSRFRVSQQIDNLVQMIKQCFPLDLYTYNMLLRRLVTNQIDDAFYLFDRLRQKGFGPDLWSYYILLCGLAKHGKKDEAKRLADEMISKGFDITGHTEQLERFRASMIR